MNSRKGWIMGERDSRKGVKLGGRLHLIWVKMGELLHLPYDSVVDFSTEFENLALIYYQLL